MKHKGFTLIEILITLAILGLLAALAIPSYIDFINQAKSAELIQRALTAQIAVELSMEDADALNDLDGGEFAIPEDKAVSNTDHGVTIADGVITATWKNDGSGLAGLTYILTPDGINSPVTWTVGGTCLGKGYCTDN